MTTHTYDDKKPKFDPNKSFEPVEGSGKPSFDPNKPFEEVKKKDSSLSGTGGGGLSPLGDGVNPFSYGALTKKPDEDKNRWVKAPMPIAKAVQEDKKKDTGTAGYIFNSIVDGVAKVIGGVPDAINAITDAGEDLIDRMHGTPGLSESIRKHGGPTRLMPGSLPRLPEGQEVVKGMQHLFGVSTSYKPPEFDVTEGVQASDVESLAVQAPAQLMDMVYGAYTGGGSFFLQSVNQNAKELSENPNAAKLSPTERLGYLYLQGGVQMAWDKFGLDKIIKATGLSQKVKQKIANEVTDELIKKGQKATAKDIEQVAFKKASSFATQVKNVGLKAATSSVAEGGTEAAQQASSDGIKLLTNKMSGSEIFDEKDITTNFVKNVINAGVQGGAFGGAAGSGVGVMQNTKKALRNEIAKATTPEDIQKMQANIAEQVKLGNITPEEAEAANITAQQYAEVAATIPETIDAEKKYALIGGIEQREELKKEIAKVNEEMSAIDPAFHEDYIAQTDLLNAKLNQTNDYIDGIATGKKPTYRKEGDAFIKTDSKGEAPISKEHYELATAVREEDAANNKMAEEISKQEIKAAKVLAKSTLPDTYQVMAEENPIGVVKDIAKQAQNLNEEFEPHNDGKESESLQRAKEVFGDDAVNEAIALYPKKDTASSMETTDGQQEGATEGVVPSTLKSEEVKEVAVNENVGSVMGQDNDLKGDVKPDWMHIDNEKRIIPIEELSERDMPKSIGGMSITDAIKNIESGKETKSKGDIEVLLNVGGKFLIRDGYHRVAAAIKNGVKEIGAVIKNTEAIKSAIRNGKYQKAISEGRMTANDAKEIIESAGLKVPQDILDQVKQQSTPTKGGVVPSTLKDDTYVSKHPKASKPISKMSSDELTDYSMAVKKYLKGIEVDMFGEEGAKKYREAQSVLNSMWVSKSEGRYKDASALVDKMEASLSPAQQKEFFGLGEPGEFYEPSELRDIATKVRLVEESENVTDLGGALKLPLLDFRRNPNDEGSLAVLNAAKNKAEELGIDPKEMLVAGLKRIAKDIPDRTDWEDLAASIIEKLSTPIEQPKLQQQSTPTNEAKETTQVPDQAEATISEPAKPDKAGSKAKKSVLERPIEEVTIEDILKELQGEEGLAFKEVSNKDIKEGGAKNIEAYNQRAERVLKTLYPNAEFKALSTTKEYEQATGRKNEAGVLIRGKDGKHKLFLNLEAIINSDIERTATHEVVHALVSDAIGAKYVDLRKKWDSLLPKLYNVKGFEIVKEHIEKYSSADRPVEGLTDLLANIVHGKIEIEDIPKNLWDEFIELVNRAFEAIGLDYKITPDTFNGFASSVKEAFETGDFTNLKKFTSKGKTEKFFAEYPEFAEAATAMIDPEKRKQLEELLKTKIQQELNQGKINQDQANEFYRRAGIEPPTGSTGEGKKRKFENNPKAILNRVYDSENISESVKQNFRDRGLTYSPQSHEQARAMAREIIDDFGVEDSIAMAEAGRFDGDVNSMIFAEGIDKTYAAEQAATTSDEKIRLAEQWADYTIRYDEAARQKGRFISAIYDFYRKSPLGVILSERRKRDEAFQDWFDKREKPYKEVFDALQKEPEFKEILKQKVETQLKQERAVSRMKRRKKISDIFDSAKLKGDQLSASIIPPPIWNATIEVMKQATLAGESIVNVIQQGVDHIKNNYAEAWDEKTFRAEWEEKLSGIDREGKIELTTEEKKQRILDKFRKKLSGLTEEQKEEVIRKSFKKLVEAGALEYDEFKKIVANVIGLGELTAEETTKLTGFIKDMNAVQDLSDALLKDETKENLKKFNEGVRKSEESATKLAGMLYTQPKVAQRLRSIIQLNTLGVVSLIKNPFYNIFHQALVRLPKGIVMTILDQSIYGASVGLNKAFGTPIVKPDVNILLGQKGYWGKGAKGGAEAIKQVFTGLTNKDYFQKEVYNSQIKPFTAWRDLWAWGRGKKNLTGGQITDKALQATIGIPAEGVARMLNIGDKPFRFAAEAAIAETIGRQQLGLKGFELEVFMRIPKEKAKAIYKKRGLSEEEANKKAELVEKRIIAEGEEAVFQQNNIVADVINKVKQALPSGNENHPLSSFGSGAIKMVGLLNMPFVKTPANIAWEVFNLVNPEFALFQSFAYGIKAAKTNSQADFLRAKKWMAHAATGWALLGAAGYLASIGAVSGDDEDEPYKAKESKGKGSYEKPHSVNISKVLRAPLGGSIETEDDDVNVDLSWFGAMGMIMNMQANKYENLTQEQRDSMAYVDDLMFRLNRGAQDGLVNSVFQGSLTAVDALRSGRHDQWLLGMLNVGMNSVEPATLAQLSRATRPAEYKITGDDLSETMMNNLKARSFGIFGNPKTKVNIWGEPMNREGSVKDVTLRMLGFSQSDTDKFARPIFEDFKRTGDASFFPPSVSPKITVDGQEKKLSSEELLQYEALIGQARKNLVAPFINNMATVKVGKKKMKYNAMDDEQKAEALKKLYEQGFNAGKKLFMKLHPEYEKD